MARVKGSWLAGRLQGSPCKNEGIYIRTNRTSGKMTAVKMCSPYTGPWTDAQKNDSGFSSQVTISPTVLESTDTSEEQGFFQWHAAVSPQRNAASPDRYEH